ncbi:MAG: holo-[acyl-carrier-protein] synthase [Candidatus Omnitrophica bacterium CG08_land_8_20_14_0_20_41_16]|uniref:Holo-[acyl-carrier-protein] synthase n=1 Tax=Candidatus Sherwoodlollariibacterium unditelluris TaxID=1974757 RepID=A0A2G9YMS9_9BACT|nr:MAG: holo-[acyl-carrier-protein] synthase [Candidatus Omnitrophica bacterium CG23_combo_of_CG06-09_8_20_14_all_41_10]PIS33563.1 MAG: holo-[acyl-carrier-protein] synthase [Candidatus Omnitrophica bacterium CG08_land_8_20_14_0_20_41_16]
MKIIGTGVDITEVTRLKKAIEKWGEAFLNRVFTDEELVNAKTRGSLYQHLAGRFAAKEAVFKALGDANLNWKDVVILNDKEGKPFCRILNSRSKGTEVIVSISHVKNYAVANAIVTKKP